jgi:Flp pilus assembly protein TadG
MLLQRSIRGIFMSHRKPRCNSCVGIRRRGTAAVEMAFVAPLLVTLMLGVWEMGQFVHVQQVISGAAREGARQASTGMRTNAQVISSVTTFVKSAGLPVANLNVTVSDLTSGTDVSQATTLDKIQVSVNIPFRDVRWTSLKLVTNDSTQVSDSAVWSSNVPRSYPNNAVVPAGD